MPHFSTRSLERLTSCHPDLQVVFQEVIKDCDCTILEGFRSRKAQNNAYTAGRSKLQFPQSKHNQSPSLAVDVAPYPIDWQDIHGFYYFGGLVLGTALNLYKNGQISHRLRWGGDWDQDHDVRDQSFNDLVHFELYKEA
ncbi:M15 family metallopeptidase [Zooshikella ganghwensis]|uniref:M15 family metallopeptidase n=1 Tax=Zooshikella ganghwensis TaxID=202772 RepID=UPI0004255D54|nr:M15 family metallopeptidase [Zooshikella ganghwensis]